METIYKNAVHYWSFDDPHNIVDLKTGARAVMAKKPTTHLTGPANLALLTLPGGGSRLQFGAIQYLCLKDPSSCPSGITITLWVKPGDIKSREAYFTTTTGSRLGLSLVSYADNPGLVFFVRGGKHKCSFLHNVYPRHWTWLFVSVAWKVQVDGTGKLYFDLINDTGVKRNQKTCPEIIHSPSESLNMMETKLSLYKSGKTFAIDELAVWNETLTEERIMEIYNLVASK